MSSTDVSTSPEYREIAEQMLSVACQSQNIGIASIEFGEGDRESDYSWLCFVVDPAAGDHVAPTSASSAADHFALQDPALFVSRQAGSQLDLTIYEIEVADQASIVVRDPVGQPMLTSPWAANLAVAKVLFNYRSAHGT